MSDPMAGFYSAPVGGLSNAGAAFVDTDDAAPDVVLAATHACASAWEPNVRLLGNVRAKDIARSIGAVLADRDAALARAEKAEAERDAARTHAEVASRVTDLTLGQMRGLSAEISRLTARIAELEAERDAARVDIEIYTICADAKAGIIKRDKAEVSRLSALIDEAREVIEAARNGLVAANPAVNYMPAVLGAFGRSAAVAAGITAIDALLPRLTKESSHAE